MPYTVQYQAKFRKTTEDMTFMVEIAKLVQRMDTLESQHAVADTGDASKSLNSSFSSQPEDTSDTFQPNHTNDYQYDSLTSSQREIIKQHLEEWEEPTTNVTQPVSYKAFVWSL